MAGAAFREQDGFEPGGADMVHRLLTHSARARSHATAARASRAFAPRLAELPAEPAVDPVLELARIEDEVAQLEAELRVVRAALRAEQEESAALRAELEQVRAYATPVGDIRHDRDRWATLVERLLFVER